jgi:hypothetical protein
MCQTGLDRKGGDASNDKVPLANQQSVCRNRYMSDTEIGHQRVQIKERIVPSAFKKCNFGKQKLIFVEL